MDEDETCYVWTFLHEAREPALIEPGAIVVAGDPDAPAVPRSSTSSTSRLARSCT